MATEGEAQPDEEKRMGETGVVLDSDWLGALEGEARVRFAGVGAESEEGVESDGGEVCREEVDSDNV